MLSSMNRGQPTTAIPTRTQSFPVSGSFPMSQLFNIRWPKCWSFIFSISPSNEYSGLISFRIDWLISLLSKRIIYIISSISLYMLTKLILKIPSMWRSTLAKVLSLERPLGLELGLFDSTAPVHPLNKV